MYLFGFIRGETKLAFNHGLKVDQHVTTEKLEEIFKHSRMSGMRKSNTTNTLVLICDHTKSKYDDRWVNDVLHYTGMGLNGNQQLNMQNKTLYYSK
jgi:5-methylcytosine-specific restriction protein A